MSHGALPVEAHEAVAQGTNIGALSNRAKAVSIPAVSTRCAQQNQFASGRFGVGQVIWLTPIFRKSRSK
jgi:glutamate synthase domain-containing protein 2